MKHTLFAISTLFLTACSIDIEESHPIVEQVFLQEEATQDGIVCTIEGSYPHISGLSSVQVEVNINAVMDDYAHKVKEAVIQCPKYLNNIVEDGENVLNRTSVHYEVTLFNDSVFSVTILSSQMLEGAAHPSNTIDTFVFDLSSGQPITLEQYFADTPEYEDILEKAITGSLLREEMDIDGSLRNPTKKFYLTNDSVVLVDLFDIHALKGFEVRIPLMELTPST